MRIKDYIKDIPNFPKEGIVFKDISPLLANPQVFKQVINDITHRHTLNKPDKIVGLDARGFIFGSAVAYALSVPFIMVRKPGKLPDECISVEYELEYGLNTFEMHTNSIKKDDNVLLIDDLLATGGSVKAVYELINKLGGKVKTLECIVELGFLKARENLKMKVNAQVIYE